MQYWSLRIRCWCYWSTSAVKHKSTGPASGVKNYKTSRSRKDLSSHSFARKVLTAAEDEEGWNISFNHIVFENVLSTHDVFHQLFLRSDVALSLSVITSLRKQIIKLWAVHCKCSSRYFLSAPSILQYLLGESWKSIVLYAIQIERRWVEMKFKRAFSLFDERDQSCFLNFVKSRLIWNCFVCTQLGFFITVWKNTSKACYYVDDTLHTVFIVKFENLNLWNMYILAMDCAYRQHHD